MPNDSPAPVRPVPQADGLAALMALAEALLQARPPRPAPIPHFERLVLSGAITTTVNRR